MFEITKPTIEEWCKEHGCSIFDQGIEESYEEFLEDFIVSYEIDGIDNGNLRVSITNGNNRTYLSWYRDIENKCLNCGVVATGL